jgi:hypothetical protein
VIPSSKSILIDATSGTSNISWNFLAAIGVEESGFRNVRQGIDPRTGKPGKGIGIFQIDQGAHPQVTDKQGFDPVFSANFAANLLQSNYNTLTARGYTRFTEANLMQATAASYNYGTSRKNISGNPATIDVGTTNGHYGSDIMNLITCFNY